MKFYLSSDECQENHDRVWKGGRGRKGKGEVGSVSFASHVALRYWNGPRQLLVTWLSYIHNTFYTRRRPHSMWKKRERERKREKKKRGRKEGRRRRRRGLRSPLVSGCWWTFLHFIPCFPPWLRASWILYDRHSPHHRLFCLLLSNNTPHLR